MRGAEGAARAAARAANALLGRAGARVVRGRTVDGLHAEVARLDGQRRALQEQVDRLSEARGRYDAVLGRLGLTDDDLRGPSAAPGPEHPGGREGAGRPADRPRPDDPRLGELVGRYRASGHPVLAHSLWDDDFVAREVDLANFRGDMAYVWQSRDLNAEVHYLVTLLHLMSVDRLGLLDRLGEDGAFGARTYRLGASTVSRDLLDSVAEISFLEDTLHLSERGSISVLDIGAGYGRLAHRLAEAYGDQVHVTCVDAVATSTFLCEYYLSYRGVQDRTTVVALDEMDARLGERPIDLAVNVHSFSECTAATIAAWLDVLVAHDVRHLLIVPNAWIHGGTRLESLEDMGGPDRPQRHEDFEPLLAERGYRLVTRRPKYPDPLVQRHGISPTHYWLFERAPSEGAPPERAPSEKAQ